MTKFGPDRIAVELKKELEAIKFRKAITDDENHALKLRLNARDALIEELRAEIAMLKKRVATVPIEGVVA